VSVESDEEFREFMRGRWPAMVRLAYGLTGDLGHAEDVAQDAFARAYAAWGRVRRAGKPGGVRAADRDQREPAAVPQAPGG
jgi:DNA-directed RNA polymerase specialized sigma24 family protein